MEPSQLFKGYNFLLVPFLRTKLASFRHNLYTKNGATLYPTINQFAKQVKKFNSELNPDYYDSEEALHYTTIIVVEDEEKLTDMTSLSSYLIVPKSGFPLDEYKVLRLAWVTDSLEEKRLLPYSKYLFSFPEQKGKVKRERESECLSDVKEEKEPSKKRKRKSVDEEHSLIFEKLASPPKIEDIKKKVLADSESLRASTPESDEEDLKNMSNNELIIHYFSQMAKERKVEGLQFKSLSYLRAINAIKNAPKEIECREDALSIPKIGKSLADHCVEIIETRKFGQLKRQQESTEAHVMKELQKIHGVGAVISEKWFNHYGVRSIPDIFEKVPESEFTDAIKLGLYYYYDWNQKIPREEVTAHSEFVSDVGKKIDPKFIVQAVGSYRRETKTCGDVDFFIMKEDCNDETKLSHFLTTLVMELFKSGYLKCSLFPAHDQLLKFLTGGQLTDKKFCRRVDFLAVKWKYRAGALIYFTGNDILNRYMRTLANNKGLRLNNEGLFKPKRRVIDEANKMGIRLSKMHFKEDDWTLVEGEDEEKIFNLLGLRYLAPKERNIGNLYEIGGFRL
ncbi:hypothetical protein LJB42_002487 [Komagataella kurtzmanii]|nr:hypothetical protein LJB42_002487 [Komagataella kurtzmanii]